MLIVMKSDATESDIRRVVETIESLGFKAHPMPGANRTANASQVGDARTVVISSAIRADNVELVEARRRGLRVWHRSAALAALIEG